VIKKIVLSAIAFTSIVHAETSTLSKVKTSFTTGDTVHIKSCDKWQWCKLSDNSGYVKGHLFKRFPKDPSIAIKNGKGITYLYNIRPIYKDDKPVFEFIQSLSNSSEKLNAQNNYNYGYIREKDLDTYEKYMQDKKKAIEKKSITDKNIKEEKLPKKESVNELKEVKLEDTNEVATDDNYSKVNNEKVVETKKNIFVYVGVDFTNSSTKKSEANVADIKDSYNGYSLGLGYRHLNNYVATLGIEKNSNTQTSISNILASINYQLTDKFLKPYVGILGGYSTLKWKENPVTTTSATKNKSKSYMLGLQMGVEHYFDSQFSFYGAYQFIPVGHKTKINQNENAVEHKTLQGIELGLRYKF
jgi:opacity protein-like surface antigen